MVKRGRSESEAQNRERQRRKGHPDQELGRTDAALAFGHESAITGRSQDAATRDSMPVDCRYHGPGKEKEAFQNVVERAQEFACVVGAAIDETLQIDTGGKDSPTPR